jgi:hypothetical protein
VPESAGCGVRLWRRSGVGQWGLGCVSRREGQRRRSGDDAAAMIDDDRSFRDFQCIADKRAMQAQALGAATAAVAKKIRMRRFTWVRAENEVYNDDIWRLVARMAGAPLHLVEIVVLRLDLFASKNRPRGSLDGFSIAALAARWNMANDDMLARIYAALEHPDIGWIDQDHLVTFWDRNPDTEDTTAADRTHRSKAFKKAMKTLGGYQRQGHLSDQQYAERVRELFALREETRRGHFPRGELMRRLDLLLNLSPAARAHDVSTVTTVSLTARSDQNLSQSGDAVDNRAAAASGPAERLSEGQAVVPASSPQDDEAAKAWLEGEGRRIVVERMDVTPTRAANKIERWLGLVDQSHRIVADAIAGAAGPNLNGQLRNAATFHVMIENEVARQRRLMEQGPKLAMGPPPTRAEQAKGAPAPPDETKAGESLRKAVGE